MAEHYNPNQQFQYNGNQDQHQSQHELSENTHHGSQDPEYQNPEHYQNEYQDQNGQFSYDYDFNDNIGSPASTYQLNEIKWRVTYLNSIFHLKGGRR